MPKIIEETVLKFDKDFAYQDKVQSDIPLADMHDWLRQALTEVATAQREADKAVLEGMKRSKWEEHNVGGQEYPLQVFNFALDEAISKIV